MPNFRPFRVNDLTGGWNNSRHPAKVADNEAADLLNVDLDRDSVKSSNGSVKFNNQVAPKPGLLTTVDPALSPLSIEAGRSVPLRGYGYLPYNEDLDIGGDFVSTGTVPTETFHNRRGPSFNFEISFKIPESEKLYEWETRGANAPASGAGDTYFETNFGYDEALDETICILQKGGDRTAPMSWFLGVTNVGGTAPGGSTTGYEIITGSDPGDRVSNYALVFGWLDSAGWAEGTVADMRYSLSNPSASSTGARSTQSYRALIIEHFVEPGRTYHVGVQLERDTAAMADSTWQDDGSFKVAVSEDLDNTPSVYTVTHAGGGSYTGNGIYVWKGPTDSDEYLIKFGIRYSGRDAMFLGLGYRFAPWSDLGFIPFGADSAPLEHGGFSMVDRTDTTVDELYGSSQHTLTISHTNGNSYITVNHQGLINGNTNGGKSPLGPNGSSWDGYNGTGSAFNEGALRGYRMVMTQGATFTDGPGGILTINAYSEPSDFRLSLFGTGDPATFSGESALVQAFRWHQRPLVLSECRFYSSRRDYTSARVGFSLRGEALLDDATEPDIESLIARWPLDDGGGGVLREIVRGVDAYLAPFSLGLSSNGSRGSGQLFLSGEGEALTLDLDDNPIFQREFLNCLQDPSGGFAIEMTCILPEAYYGVDKNYTGTEYRAQYCPHLISWEIKDPENDGLTTNPQPLLLLSHRAEWSTTSNTANRRPMGFAVFVGDGTDQQNEGLQRAVVDWTGAGGFFWDTDASWVGKRLTLQMGIESTGTADTYHVYLSVVSKNDTLPADGDPSNAEFAYYGNTKASSLASTTFTIGKKDLARSIITIGGCWDAKTLADGYSEANARIILDEVRIFGAAAPGTLPSTNGAVVTTRDGKLQGARSLPARKLTRRDILRQVGSSLVTANLTENSTTVSTPGQTTFFVAEPEDTIDAVKETYLLVGGDTYELVKKETTSETFQEFYFVSSVDSNGDSLTIKTPYSNATQVNASCYSFRLIGYTAFDNDYVGLSGPEDVRDKPLTLGRGANYVPGSSTVDDITQTGDYFTNLAPLGRHFSFRVLSPVGASSSADILPKWVRGLQSPRKNKILGAVGVNDRILMGAQGSLFEVDDRWRKDTGPTDTFTSSLAFYGREVVGRVMAPLHDDRVEFSSASGFTIASAAAINSLTLFYDFWIYRLPNGGVYQTIAWVGNPGTDPALNASATAGLGHKAHTILRLWEGRPQFVLGSTNTYDGSNKPEGGYYVAQSAATVPEGKWAHIRWVVDNNTTGTIIQTPECYVNGKSTTVTVNATDNGVSASGDWLLTAGLVQPGGSGKVILGAARDSFLLPEEDVTFVVDKLRGLNMRPDRLQGWLHSAHALLSNVVVGASVASMSTDFDPHSFDYTTVTPTFRARLNEDVGHKVEDTVGAQFGVIYSHPFISRFHEMGRDPNRLSFATFGNEVFIANGGRVVVEEEGSARFAGVLPPTTRPSFDVDREPLWAANTAVTDPSGNADTGTSADGNNDPVWQSSAGDATQLLHYSTRGNHYMLQSYHSEMDWASGDVFAFKCLLRMRSTTGRILVYSQKDSVSSGRSLEIRNGKLGFYWWDTFLKTEVGIETSSPVIIPGYVHYIYFRKRWPQNNSTEGNWVNQNPLADAASTNDMMVVRRFRKADSSNAWETDTTFDAKTDEASIDGGTMSGVRNCISFTTDDVTAPTGSTATGCIGTLTCSGASGGVVTIDSAAKAFHADMKGMIWQWGSGAGATFTGVIYRIVDVDTLDAGNFASQITVVAENGTSSTDFSSITAKTGAVFTGISLVKSTSFDLSKYPDNANYEVQLMGSALQGNPLNGYRPFDGEMWCPGYVSTSSLDKVFEDEDDVPKVTTRDRTKMGTDDFAGEVYSASAVPGALRFDQSGAFGTGGVVFTCLDPENATPASYATTQPNQTLQVLPDTTQSSVNAPPLFWQSLASIQLLQGTSQVYVTFYDRENNVESNPSPVLTIEPSANDKANAGLDAQLQLTDLPVSPGLERRIYMTLVDGSQAFRVAEVPDDTSSSIWIFKTQDQIAQGVPLSFFNNAPPRCSIVGAAQSRMFYGNTPTQPDGVFYSLPFTPERVPLADPFGNPRLLIMDRADNAPIRGMYGFKGALVVGKENALWTVDVSTGIPTQQLVTTSLGIVSDQSFASLDNWLYGVGPKGPWTWSGSGIPWYLGYKLEPYFSDTLDRKYLYEISAALNRDKNQYVFTTRRDGEFYSNERLAFEFDHETAGTMSNQKRPAFHRLTRYRDPNASALCEVDSQTGGPRLFVAGTEEGFAVWLDRSDVTTTAMMGPDTDIHGATSITVGASSTTTKIVTSSGTHDTSLEGPRGARVRWRPTSTTDGEGVILFAESTALHLDRVSSLTLPSSGDAATVGELLRLFLTKHFDFGEPDIEKTLRWLRMTRAVESSGNLDIDVFVDLSSTAFSFNVARTLDLTDAVQRVDLTEVLEGQRHQFRFKTIATDSGITFELFDLTAQVTMAEEG